MAVLVVLTGVAGAATGEAVFIGIAAVPCVVAVFWLVVSWEWLMVMEPWTIDRPKLRKPLLALNALHWLGPLALTFVEPGGDGHGELAQNKTCFTLSLTVFVPQVLIHLIRRRQ